MDSSTAITASQTMTLGSADAPAPCAQPLALGSLQLKTRFLLSPLAGYTNLPFRLAVRELGGVGLATTDLVNARALLMASRKTLELIQTTAADAPLSVQIYGADPKEMSDGARWLETYGVASIDINMGCPVHKVVRGGGGSALMCRPTQAVDLVRAVVEAVRIPVTVKMRLGWDQEHLTAPHFAREFEQAGAAGIVVHGRTRAQGFAGSVNLDGIQAVVESVQRIPIIGNGDVRTITDAARMLEVTGCAGISIGRGALLNPWVFSQLERWDAGEQPAGPPSFAQRVTFMERHYRLLVRQRGEHFASLTFRKVANWYCKVLRPGRAIQQRLIRLDGVATFEEIVAQLREMAVDRQGGWETDAAIAVPSGPIERW